MGLLGMQDREPGVACRVRVMQAALVLALSLGTLKDAESSSHAKRWTEEWQGRQGCRQGQEGPGQGQVEQGCAGSSGPWGVLELNGAGCDSYCQSWPRDPDGPHRSHLHIPSWVSVPGGRRQGRGQGRGAPAGTADAAQRARINAEETAGIGPHRGRPHECAGEAGTPAARVTANSIKTQGAGAQAPQGQGETPAVEDSMHRGYAGAECFERGLQEGDGEAEGVAAAAGKGETGIRTQQEDRCGERRRDASSATWLEWEWQRCRLPRGDDEADDRSCQGDWRHEAAGDVGCHHSSKCCDGGARRGGEETCCCSTGTTKEDPRGGRQKTCRSDGVAAETIRRKDEGHGGEPSGEAARPSRGSRGQGLLGGARAPGSREWFENPTSDGRSLDQRCGGIRRRDRAPAKSSKDCRRRSSGDPRRTSCRAAFSRGEWGDRRQLTGRHILFNEHVECYTYEQIEVDDYMMETEYDTHDEDGIPPGDVLDEELRQVDALRKRMRRRWMHAEMLSTKGTTKRIEARFAEVIHNNTSGPMRLSRELHMLLDVHEETQKAVEQLEDTNRLNYKMKPYHIDIYTDGSRNSQASGWGFACLLTFEESQQGQVLHGFTGGSLDLDHSVYDAEVMAAIYAVAWLEWFIHHLDLVDTGVTFHIDNEAARAILCGTSKKVVKENLPAILSYSYTKLRCKKKAVHVKSHSGNAWNELADSCARSGRDGLFDIDYYEHISNLFSESMHDLLKRHIIEEAEDEIYGLTETTQTSFTMPDKHLAAEDLAAAMQRALPMPTRARGAQDINIATMNVKSLVQPGRSAHIQKQAHEQNLQIVGLQETRTGAGYRATRYFHIFSGGAERNVATNFGCEIWVARSFKRGQKTVKVEKQDLHVAFQNPRSIGVMLRSPLCNALIVSAHAPLSTAGEEAVEDFWDGLRTSIEAARRPHAAIILCADFNWQLRNIPEVCGDLAPQMQGDADTLHPAEVTLKLLGLCTPHTEPGVNIDGRLLPTCMVNNGETMIDYIAVSKEWAPYARTSEVSHDIDIMMSSLDHMPVITRFKIMRTPQQLRRSRHCSGFDSNALRDPQNKAVVASILQDIPEVDKDVQVSTHVHMVNTYVVECLRDAFPPTTERPYPEWMSTETIEMIRTKKDNFKEIIRRRRLGFTGGDPELDRRTEEAKTHCGELKKLLRRDRERHIDSIVTDTSNAFDIADSYAAYQGVKKLRPYCPRPSKPLTDETGRLILDQEHAEEFWTRHWAEHFNGAPTTFTKMYEEDIQDHGHPGIPDANVAEAIPAAAELSIAFASAKARKQHGNDLIPAEVWRCDAAASARTWHPVAVKAVAGGKWPIQWSGATQIGIPKSNGKIRGIALGDSSAKAVSKCIRGKLMTEMEQEAPQTAFGGFAQRGTEFANLTMQQLQRTAENFTESHAFLFIDMRAAFDMVQRDKIPMRTWTEATVQAMHRRTWGVTMHNDTPYSTLRGVRQGDPIADAAFLCVFTQALREIQAILDQHGCTCRVIWRQGAMLCPEDDLGEAIDNIADLSYIDDVALLIRGGDVFKKLATITDEVKKCVAKYGFELNFDKGKTSAVVHPHGKGMMKVKQQLRRCEGKIHTDGGDTLHLVSSYVHLGLRHGNKGQSARRAAHFCDRLRLKTKENAKILKAKNLSMKHKFKVLDTCLASAAYSIGSWDPPTRHQMKMMESVHMQAVRTITGTKYNPMHPDARLTDKQVRKAYGVLSIAELFKLRRLQLFSRVLCKAPMVTKCLVQMNARSEDGWAMAVRKDLAWLYQNSTKAEHMPCPDTNPEAWERLASEYPNEWRLILKDLSDSICSGQCPDQHEEENVGRQGEYPCFTCGQVFYTEQGRCLHAALKHGRRAKATRYAVSPTCAVCLRDYGSMHGVQRHLAEGYKAHGVTSCMGQMIAAGIEPNDAESIEAIRQQMRVIEKQNRRRGIPQAGFSSGVLQGNGPVDEAVYHGPMPKDD
eukprot:TRINITY_DN70171_c0_g1_i2.p1 TRINITY_DN70171_c0_g1~~TRINITY_DN70171_c0_g1_i2.p1  ORF type:complete len:1961 (+),score=321.68 TRINITY_DN70171_c0_g1_i2:217-6099(+)